MSENLKNQRDRFLAFAFASADVFLEISPEGTILFATGAVQSIIGEKGGDLAGQKYLDLFSAYEQARMLSLQEDTPVGVRCGPFLLNMNAKHTDRKAVMTGIKMPYSSSFFITISLSNEFMDEAAQSFEDEFDDSIYNKGQFIDAADKIFNFARTTEKDADLTVFDFGRTETITEESWAETFSEISKLMRASSIDGKAVGNLSENQYALIHDHDIDMNAVIEQIKSIVKDKHPDADDFNITNKTLNGDLENISQEDAINAFRHSITAIANGSDELQDAETLAQSLKMLVTDNESKMVELKNYIDTVNFKFHFQPIARLKDYELSHYEMLCRFNTGNTKDWVNFARDCGMSAQLDLAVCERAVNHLTMKLGVTRTMYAMNMLPSSLEDPEFLETFMEHLEKESNMHERMIIEIMDMKRAEISDKLRLFTTQLQDKGFKIALDGITANAKSIEAISTLNCDFAKLDGSYSKLILESEHERSMVEHLAKICAEQKVVLIAKHIESKEHADAFKALNVKFGQGHFFGEAQSGPAYQKPSD